MVPSDPILADQELDENLVAAIAASFDGAGIDNVLWGDCLLTVFGVPSGLDVGIQAASLNCSALKFVVLGRHLRCAGR